MHREFYSDSNARVCSFYIDVHIYYHQRSIVHANNSLDTVVISRHYSHGRY